MNWKDSNPVLAAAVVVTVADLLNERTSGMSPIRAAALLALLLGPLACGSPRQDLPGAHDDISDDNVEQVQSALTVSLPAFPFHHVPVEIVNVGTGQCLSAGNGGVGTIARTESCTSVKSQEWFMVPATSANEYHVRLGNVGWRYLGYGAGSAFIQSNGGGNQRFRFNTFTLGGTDQFTIQDTNASPQCLTGGNFTGATMTSCTGSPPTSKQWLIRPRAKNFHFIAKHSRKCMDVQGASQGNNALVQQFGCAEGAGNQGWSLQPDGMSGSDRFFTIRSANGGKCLDVPNASGASGIQLQQFTCNGGDNQRWKLLPEPDGRVSIVNKNSGLCVDVPGASTSDNAVLQQFTCNGGDNQKWYYTNYVKRHIHVIQAADSAGHNRTTTTDADIATYLGVVSNVYGQYGIDLVYDPCNNNDCPDRSNADSDCLYSLADGSSANWGCASTLGAVWPNKVVVIMRSGVAGGFSYGYINFIASIPLSPITLKCGDTVEDKRHIAHEFGHYMGLQHTFPADNSFPIDNDLLSESFPDPHFEDCLDPFAASPPGTASGPGGVVVNTDNVMSYYYHVTPRIGPNQAAIVRGTNYARFY